MLAEVGPRRVPCSPLQGVHVKVRVVAYATNEAYWNEAQKLRLSLEELMIPHRIYRENKPDWTWDRAVRWKPAFCLRELAQAKSLGFDAMLYVDADAIFRTIPDWSQVKTADVGAHWFQRTKHHNVELLTGTLFFRCTPRIEILLEHWIEITGRVGTSPTPEQHSLILALKDRDDLCIRDFGPEWVYIFDDFRSIYTKSRPVIEHFQASRRLRK